MTHAPERDDAVGDFVASMWTSHAGVIRSRLISMTKGDRYLAEDLLLETFTRLLRHLRRGGHRPEQPRAWLMLTAKRIFIDHARLASTRNEETRERLPHPATQSDFEAIERREEAEAILGMLPPLQRQIMEMRDFEDLPTKDVAAKLGLTGQAVRSIRHKAVQKIRQEGHGS